MRWAAFKAYDAAISLAVAAASFPSSACGRGAMPAGGSNSKSASGDGCRRRGLPRNGGSFMQYRQERWPPQAL